MPHCRKIKLNKLFDIHASFTGLEPEIRKLCLRIETNEQGPRSQVELTLRITDPESSDFLYVMQVNEASYPDLKNQLKIVVDFVNFPEMLIYELEKYTDLDIVAEKGTTHYMVLCCPGGDQKKCTLELMEQTPFRKTAMMVFPLRQATSAECIGYLGEELEITRQQKNDLNQKYELACAEREGYKEKVRSLSAKYSESESIYKKSMENQEIKFQKKLNAMKEAAIEKRRKETSIADEEKRRLVEQHKALEVKLHDQISRLTKDVSNQSQELLMEKAARTNTETQLTCVRREVESSNKELEDLRQKMVKSQKQIHELRLNNQKGDVLLAGRAEEVKSLRERQIEHAEAVAHLREEISRLNNQITTLIAEKQKVRKSNSTLKEFCLMRDQTLRVQAEKINSLNRALTEANERAEKSIKLEGQLAQANESKSCRETQFDALNAENKKLNEEVQSLKDKLMRTTQALKSLSEELHGVKKNRLPVSIAAGLARRSRTLEGRSKGPPPPCAVPPMLPSQVFSSRASRDGYRENVSKEIQSVEQKENKSRHVYFNRS